MQNQEQENVRGEKGGNRSQEYKKIYKIGTRRNLLTRKKKKKSEQKYNEKANRKKCKIKIQQKSITESEKQRHEKEEEITK